MNEKNDAAGEAAEASVKPEPPAGKRRIRGLRLPHKDFPDPPITIASNLPATIDNLLHLLRAHRIEVGFNVITKRLECLYDGRSVSLGEVISLANLNQFPTGWVQHFLYEIGVSQPRNPVRDWISGRPWDGQSRLQDFCATVVERADYPTALKDILIHRWLLSAAAAVLCDRPFKGRGVLTLQGPQGIGKTSWMKALLPPGPLREECIKLDHHLDGSDKDSVIGAVSAWITEIGELDSSLRKDVARLKGFLTRDWDKLRPPYAREQVEWQRRTVFGATVNDEQFLVDHTGNSRWWTISCEKLNFNHDIDMQQLFAELALQYRDGGQWWLTFEEEKLLAAYNLRHRSVSAIADRVQDCIDVDGSRAGRGHYYTATELLALIGVKSPTNIQCKEAGAALRELLGNPKRIQGRDKWRISIQEPQLNSKDPSPAPYDPNVPDAF
jgi:putative DNA primase/helicase